MAGQVMCWGVGPTVLRPTVRLAPRRSLLVALGASGLAGRNVVGGGGLLRQEVQIEGKLSQMRWERRRGSGSGGGRPSRCPPAPSLPQPLRTCARAAKPPFSTPPLPFWASADWMRAAASGVMAPLSEPLPDILCAWEAGGWEAVQRKKRDWWAGRGRAGVADTGNTGNTSPGQHSDGAGEEQAQGSILLNSVIPRPFVSLWPAPCMQRPDAAAWCPPDMPSSWCVLRSTPLAPAFSLLAPALLPGVSVA